MQGKAGVLLPIIRVAEIWYWRLLWWSEDWLAKEFGHKVGCKKAEEVGGADILRGWEPKGSGITMVIVLLHVL